LKKTRKKTVPVKATKDTKRKDEIDKENLEKVILILLPSYSMLYL
jgi:hypothetical protein